MKNYGKKLNFFLFLSDVIFIKHILYYVVMKKREIVFSNLEKCLNYSKLIMLTFFIVFLSTFVFAIDDLMTLQGNVQQSGVNLDSGNLTVYIFDAMSGGNLIWNSTLEPQGNFNNSISSGKYDVLLGNSSTNSLSLQYGKLYYIEMYVNNEAFNFNGSSRQIFQSSVGNVTFVDITGGENIVFSNASVTFTDGQNVSTGTGGWFKGLFNWLINSGDGSDSYLDFNGSTLSFDESQLNVTIVNKIGVGNQTTLSINNITDFLYNYNQTLVVFTGATLNNTIDQRAISSVIANATYHPIGQNIFDQQLNTTSFPVFS